jgi:hypothetical protein
MQGDLSALERGGQTNIAKPHLGEGHKIGGDDDIDILTGALRQISISSGRNTSHQ